MTNDEGITKHEARMTKQAGAFEPAGFVIRHWGIRHSFVIRHSSEGALGSCKNSVTSPNVCLTEALPILYTQMAKLSPPRKSRGAPSQRGVPWSTHGEQAGGGKSS